MTKERLAAIAGTWGKCGSCQVDIPDMAREILRLWEEWDALQAQCDDLLRPIAESADAGMKERDAMREAWLAEMERFDNDYFRRNHDKPTSWDIRRHMREWSEQQGGKG
jgi:hypothetical protein